LAGLIGLPRLKLLTTEFRNPLPAIAVAVKNDGILTLPDIPAILKDFNGLGLLVLRLEGELMNY
jgi:hypothetical protein